MPACSTVSKLDSSLALLTRYGSYAWDSLSSALAFTTTTATSAPTETRHGSSQAALIAIAGTRAAGRKMPERPLTIATYAAGASLAAITLVYVFGPTFFLDDDAANSSRAGRKKGVVGLINPANDCFINSVLQALAGLPELRVYLIREMHRRRLDGSELYQDLTAALEEQQKKNKNSKQTPEWKVLSLQQGLVTAGLKDVLDALNERPIYKKAISAQAFIRVLEQSFRTRINRSQQDAQEFLQLVAERLDDEYYAGRRVRRRARRKGLSLHVPETPEPMPGVDYVPGEDAGATLRLPSDGRPRDSKVSAISEASEEPAVQESSPSVTGVAEADVDENDDDDDGLAFPFEGKLEAEVECLQCHFKPKASSSSFVSLTLHIPQHLSSTTLNACFDGMLKVEHINDFVCDRCRLEHAIQVYSRQLSKPSLPSDQRAALERDRAKLEEALHTDPEKPPKDVKLPDLSSAPKREITRHMRISSFPRILAIHLSRSVWDSHSSSTKNLAKVSFPETLPLGGLLDRKTYRLLSVVTHKGGHNSGHYETFRRQFLSPPFSTPTSMGTEGIYSLRSSPAPSPNLSAVPSPRPLSNKFKDVGLESQPSTPETAVLSTPSLISPSTSSASSHSFQSPTFDKRRPPPTSVPLEAIPAPGLPSPPSTAQKPAIQKPASNFSGPAVLRSRTKRKGAERWWRISDDNVKESKTSDVLKMQREVYLLFYEMVDEARS